MEHTRQGECSSAMNIPSLEEGGIAVLKVMGPIKITKCTINIHAKILETRLERLMNKLIHRGQVGFMRHEIITDSLKKGFMLMQIDNDTQTLVFANSINTQEVCNRME